MNRKKDFSGVISITKNGEVIFQHAYGMKDREKGMSNDLNTRFCVGSMISKPITALSIMQLIERNKLTLQTPIEEFFPHYKGSGITIHHLLNHTSGIVNYLMLRKKIGWDKDHTPEEILQIVKQEKLKYTPGKKAAYNNTAYLMLGLIVSKLSGVPYEQYVRGNVFERAGMTNTGFIRDNLDGYALNYRDHKIGPHVSPTLLFACGEIVSTIEDIHRFVQALQTEVLAKKETIELMQSPSYSGKYVTFGYGWFIKNLMGHKSVSHGGNHPGGYTSHIERYLDDNLTIVVLSNDITSYSPLMMKDFGATFISRDIAAILFNSKLHFWQKMF